MVAAIGLAFVSTNALLARGYTYTSRLQVSGFGDEDTRAATSTRTVRATPPPSGSSRATMSLLSGCRTRTRMPCPLRGRVDSARAEELLAGLGYTVDSSNSNNSTTRTKGQTKRRSKTGSISSGDKEDENRASTQQRGDHDQERTVEGIDDTLMRDREKLDFLKRHNYVVSGEDRLYFERNGHLVTRGLFTEGQLNAIRPHVVRGLELREVEALRQKVSVWFGDETAGSLGTAAELRARLKRIAPDDVPFLQVFNMFRKDGPHRQAIENLVCSPRLGHVASQLLGCERIRVYQDSTFSKRPGDGPTRWHSDLNMAPLDCNDFITAWIPMAPVPSRKKGGSPLVFASRSHRDFALNHWQEQRWQEDLTGRYAKKDHAPLAAGDVTWHHGWTLHSSPGNTRDETRTAIAISFFRDGTRVLSSSAKRMPDPEDKWSYADWIKDVPPGDVLDHPAVPLVWTGAGNM